MHSNTMGSIFALSFTFSFFFLISQTTPLQESPQKQSTIFKTIHTQYGDIFDCVDIHRQPSLAHPSLQNHTIQMKPSFMLEESPSLKNYKYAQVELEDGGCPEGSVPIKRVTEEDRLRLQTYLKKYPSALNPNIQQNSGWHGASINTIKGLAIPFTGAKGILNVYNPSVSIKQHSDSLVYIQNGAATAFNAIQAGWTVFPAIYGDNLVRLHTMWTADNYKSRGCIDMHCPGFVQVSKNFAPGSVIRPVSQYGGEQYVIPIGIIQDQFSGNWWLIASKNVMVGYWPKSLFTGLSESVGDEVGWGGRAYGPEGMAPPMGSGAKPDEGYGKSCFVQEMQFVRNHQGTPEDVDNYMLEKRVDETNNCYGVKLFLGEEDHSNIFFGGPGGKCP